MARLVKFLLAVVAAVVGIVLLRLRPVTAEDAEEMEDVMEDGVPGLT